LQNQLINSAQEFSEIAEEIPQRLQDEWSSFKEEVIEESERLEKETSHRKNTITTKRQPKQIRLKLRLTTLDPKSLKLIKVLRKEIDIFSWSITKIRKSLENMENVINSFILFMV